MRNPREVLLRNHEYRMSYSGCDDSFEDYFSHIDYFLNFNGEKKIFFYEDMIQDKKSFMYELYIFLSISINTLSITFNKFISILII